MCRSGLTWPWHFISGFTSSLVNPGSTNKVRWNAWLLRLCHIFLLDGWILIPDICRDPTRIHCLERSNESQPGPASLRASRKRIDLPEPEGLICTETGEFAKIIITDASQCWYLHKHNSAILPCKKSTVTTHPQQCREENQGPCHCGSSLVSLGKYCKNNVTSRDYEHLNNAMGNGSFCANGSMLHIQCGHGHQSNMTTKSAFIVVGCDRWCAFKSYCTADFPLARRCPIVHLEPCTSTWVLFAKYFKHIMLPHPQSVAKTGSTLPALQRERQLRSSAFPNQADNLSLRCFSRKSKNYSFPKLVPSFLHRGGRWSLVCLQVPRPNCNL